MSENSNIQQVDPIQALQSELNDAHLVIGQQQVALIRLQQMARMQQQRITELESKYESETTKVD